MLVKLPVLIVFDIIAMFHPQPVCHVSWKIDCKEVSDEAASLNFPPGRMGQKQLLRLCGINSFFF